MTIQSLSYIVAVAEAGSITEAAKKLHISQPSLSAAVKEAEREVGFKIFTRSRSGIALTKEGVEFLGYARQVIQEMRLLEDRFILNQPEKQRFCVSTQHYTFTANAFVEMVQKFGRERFEFILNETQTHQILEDVKNRFCDLGILYLCGRNEAFLRKTMDEMGLRFQELFTAAPQAFLRAEHPLAGRASVTLKDLQPYPRLNFLQGNYESADFSEEPFSTVFAEKEIRVSDRAVEGIPAAVCQCQDLYVRHYGADGICHTVQQGIVDPGRSGIPDCNHRDDCHVHLDWRRTPDPGIL